MKTLLTLGIALALTCAAQAYPTLTGPTGLATLPTAAVAQAGQFQLAADYYDTEGDSTIPVRLLYGIGDSFEIGATYVSSEINGWGINGKWLTPLTLGGFNWALGAQYLTYSDDIEDIEGTIELEVNGMQVYFVGTRMLMDPDVDAIGLNGTLGANWTKVELDVEGFINEDESAFRLFGGLDATFANRLTLAAELQMEEEDIADTDMLWSIVARYPFSDAIAVQIGYTNASMIGFATGFNGGSESNLFAGLTFGWGTADE